MGSAWIGAVSALGGVIIGIAAEALRARAAFRREKDWDLHEFERTHLEAVYEALDEVRSGYARTFHDTISMVETRKVTLPDADENKPIPWSRLRMLVHLYLPELRDELAKVEEAGPAFGKAMAKAIVKMPADASANKQLRADLFDDFRQFTAVAEAMRDQIVSLSERTAFGKASLAGRPKLPRGRITSERSRDPQNS